MVVPAFDAAADRHPHHERGRILAARTVAELGELIHDLIEGRVDVVAELDLGNGAETVKRHADRGPNDARFGERRVDAAIGPELFLKPDRGPEDAAETPDVLAENDHPLVATHLEPKRVVHGL